MTRKERQKIGTPHLYFNEKSQSSYESLDLAFQSVFSPVHFYEVSDFRENWKRGWGEKTPGLVPTSRSTPPCSLCLQLQSPPSSSISSVSRFWLSIYFRAFTFSTQSCFWPAFSSPYQWWSSYCLQGDDNFSSAVEESWLWWRWLAWSSTSSPSAPWLQALHCPGLQLTPSMEVIRSSTILIQKLLECYY